MQKTSNEMRISDWSSDVCSPISSSTTISSGHWRYDEDIPAQLRTRHSEPITGATVDLEVSDIEDAGIREVLQTPAKRGIALPRGSEERRGGKEWVSTCRSGWVPNH